MANISNMIDPNAEPSAPFEIIPAGDYKMQILTDSLENTKNGNGQFLKLELEIIEGSSAGRKVYDRLNLINDNTKAVEIANRTFAAICQACNVSRVNASNDTTLLHMKPMIVKIAVTPRNDRPGEYSNEIKGYSPLSAGIARAPVQATAPVQQGYMPPPQAQGFVPAWKRTAA